MQRRCALSAIQAPLAFTRPEDVLHEADGFGRARALRPDDLHDSGAAFAHHTCTIRDCSAPGGLVPDVTAHGFGHVDLTTIPGLPEILERVRQAGEATDQEARAIRKRLTGAVLSLANRRRLRLLFIAPEGFIVRRGGPNGLRVTDSATAPGMNNHDAAVSVHADQNVEGTPIRQLLRGVGPWAFHHQSPRRSNTRSPLFLLNLWIPLQQATRPLCLMDIRTLNRRAHQLRYGLQTDAFLNRPDDQRINDIWTFLHDPAQDWYFTAESGPHRAYIFQTLSTPHGATVLPGEALAEQLYGQLKAAREAVAAGEVARLHTILKAPPSTAPPPVTAPLIAAVSAMQDRLAEARQHAMALCAGQDAEAWDAAAAWAMDGVVRKSIEMRAVGLVTRALW